MADEHRPVPGAAGGIEPSRGDRPVESRPESAERRAVEVLAETFVAELRQWVSIPSVGTDPAHRADVHRSARWLAEVLSRDGWPTVEVWDAGPALPAVYACWPADDPAAPTALVYGHHDVQPVDPIGLWRHPPFDPVVVGEELFGRGASDDKGQVAMHLLGMRAHLATLGRAAPAMTVKLLVEGEEESGSPHLAELIDAHRDRLGCDLAVVSDTAFYDRAVPTVCTGQRGMLAAELVLTSGMVDLHSGRFGGAVPNPAVALGRLIAALHDEDGRVRIPGFYADVREPSAVERADFARLPFDETVWRAGAAGGVAATEGEAGWSPLERTWVRPTAEVNGMVSGYTGPGVKTIVPHRASAKLSFRLVPDQRPERISDLFRAFVAEHTPAGTHADLRFVGSIDPYAAPTDHPATWAVRDALHLALDHDVLFSRAGGSGPAAVLHHELTTPVVYFGVGLPDDRIHGPNERAVIPLLLRGAEAAAHLWRLLPQRMAVPTREHPAAPAH